MSDVERAQAAVIQAVVTFANDLLAGNEAHTGQIENQIASLVEAVRRDERAATLWWAHGIIWAALEDAS